MCPNMTCNKIVSRNVISHIHVHVLCVGKPLYCLQHVITMQHLSVSFLRGPDKGPLRFKLTLNNTFCRFHKHCNSSPEQNGCNFTDDIFKFIFMNEKVCIVFGFEFH